MIMDIEQIANDIALRIHTVVDDERKRNPDGDIISNEADFAIDGIQEAILDALTSAIEEGNQLPQNFADDNSKMERLVDLEFNQLVHAIMLVVEHEKTLETDTDYLSVTGSKMLHETLDVTIENIKEMV
jgi:hypothetical protein